MSLAERFASTLGKSTQEQGEEKERTIVLSDGTEMRGASQPLFLLGQVKVRTNTPTVIHTKADHFTGVVYEQDGEPQFSAVESQWAIEASRMIQFMNRLEMIDTRTTIYALLIMVRKEEPTSEAIAKEIERIRSAVGIEQASALLEYMWPEA